MADIIIPSSGSYGFQSIKAELIIREAFELIGIPGSLVVVEQLEGATRSINFLLLDLSNRNDNLWTIQKYFIPLIAGQTAYTLPNNLLKVIQVELRTSTRDLTGSAFASSGTAAFAFDGDSTTACTQTAIDGNIGFQYIYPEQIVVLGVQSMTTQNYTLVFEASNDNITWTPLLTNPILTYIAGTIVWFYIPNTVNYLYYQIRETGGQTLNISELYFNDQTVDYSLTEISNYEYFKFPIKNNIGRPTIFNVDYQIAPTLNIWQAPDVQYNLLMVSYQSMIQTLISYTESLNIPNYFYQAIVYGLAKSLAIKYAPDKLQIIIPEFEAALERSIIKNTVTVPLRFEINVNK